MLAALLAMHHHPVQPERLRHEIGHDRPLTVEDMVRLACRQRDVRCRAVTADFAGLRTYPLPALADGAEGWFLIGRVDGDEVVIQRPGGAGERCSRERLEEIWSGTLVLLATRPTEQSAPPQFDASWFIPQIVRYRHLIGEVLLITLALNLLGLAAPLLFQNVIDKVVVHNTASTLNVLAFGFVVASIWEVLLGWLRTRLYSEVSQKIDVELGARLFRHLLRLPLDYFETRRVGDTVARVRQIESIREFMTNASLSVLIDPFFTIVFLVAMWVYAPRLLLIVMATLPLYAVVSAVATGPLRRLLSERFEKGAASNSFLVESVASMATIKSAAIEPLWQQQWEHQLASYSAASQRVINLSSSATQAIQLISKLGFAALLFFGAREVIMGRLSVGGLVAFNMLSQRVAQPVLRLAQLWQDFQQVRLSTQRVGDVMNRPAEPSGRSDSIPARLNGEIQFEKVWFRYPQASGWTLEDLNFRVAPGEMLGIAGTSGSGKSTIARLMQRLHMAGQGRILIDGIDIAQVDPAWLRRQIGVVPQECRMFNRSIRGNIALARPGASLEEVIRASRLAGAHDFIMRLPDGYDAMVEEHGANLSGGQRQRIAIARALLTRPRILILDEATSALDAESEEAVRANLQAIAQGRTVIIIAHRLSALRDCQRILTLEQGRIVETGSHAELVSAGGRYADLCRRQMSWADVAA